jgi:hypothetical protein
MGPRAEISTRSKQFCDAVQRLYLFFAGGGGIATALIGLLVFVLTATNELPHLAG